MMASTPIYFPDRFLEKRQHLNNAIATFSNTNFNEDAYAFHYLQRYISQYVEHWNLNTSIAEKDIDQYHRIWHKLMCEKGNNLTTWSEMRTWAQSRNNYFCFPRLLNETYISRALIDYHNSGKKIIQIPGYLSEIWVNLELPNINFNKLRISADTVYFHFGTMPLVILQAKHIQALIESEPNIFQLPLDHFLEGAFVTFDGHETIQILLTFYNEQNDYNTELPLDADLRFPILDFSIDFSVIDSSDGFMVDNGTLCNSYLCCSTGVSDDYNSPVEFKYPKIKQWLCDPISPECTIDNDIINTIDQSLSLIINALLYAAHNERHNISLA